MSPYSNSKTQPFVPFPAGLVPVRIVRRRNRFVIEVTLDNETTIAGAGDPSDNPQPKATATAMTAACPLALHMPNTGRMSELLTPGAIGLAALDGGGERKTAGTLLLVHYADRWVSVDARMPNRLLEQALAHRFMPSLHDYDEWRSEFAWGGGRIDFKLWTGPSSNADETTATASATEPRRMLIETKSCNLVEGGIALFPDAPTERGARHLADLADAVAQGYRAAVVWFVQRDDARRLAPHREADPTFGEAFDKAVAAGVEAYAYRCRVEPSGITVLDEIPVIKKAPV